MTLRDLKAYLASCAPETAILIWVPHKPRIATMRPIALALQEAGYAVCIAYPPELDVDAATLTEEGALPCFEVAPEALRNLRNVAVFISSEQVMSRGPVAARRVAIHHSLPDYRLRNDYFPSFVRRVLQMAQTDYYLIPVCQRPEDWIADRFSPALDRTMPAPLLKGRLDHLRIVPFGYPKIDRMMAEDSGDIETDTITYAPTQSTLGVSCVQEKGAGILEVLLDSFPDHRIAFRPYPGADIERLADLIDRFRDHPRFHLDDTPTGEALNRRTALMVTDQSSVAMSFGLGFARPVVFFRNAPLLGRSDGQVQKVRPIGMRVTTLDGLRREATRLLAEAEVMSERIKERRGDFIFNIGGATQYLVGAMPDIIAGRSRSKWLDIPRRPFEGVTQADYDAGRERIISHLKGLTSRGNVYNVDQIRAAFDRGPNPPRIRMWDRLLRKTKGLRRYLSRPMDHGSQ